MPYKLPVAVLAAFLVCPSLIAQSPWSSSYRLELRADYRWSDDERNPVAFPPGAALETPDPGHHVELNVADIQLDTGDPHPTTSPMRLTTPGASHHGLRPSRSHIQAV